MQLFVEIVETQRCLVAKDNELHPGACDGDVHAAKVAQETDIALGIVSDQGNQDDVALLSLESVNGVDGNQTPVRFEERLLFHHLAQILHLGAIWRDDAYVNMLLQDTLLANLLKVKFQYGQCE